MIRAGYSMLAAAFLAAAPVLYAADPVPPAERLQLADSLYAREMYSLAATEYEAFLKENPADPAADVATFRLAECYRALARHLDADKLYKRVFDQYPGSAYRHRAGFRRADIYMELGRPQAAISLFDAVLAENPPADIASASLFFKAEALLQRGDTTNAVQALERVRQDFPQSTYYPYALVKLGGLAETETGADTGANTLNMLEEALAKAPSDRIAAEALFQIGEAHFRRKDYGKSASAFSQLLARYPNDMRVQPARLRGAWASYHAGLHADALRLVEDVLGGIAPDECEDWLYLKANCQRRLMRETDALKTYDELLAAFPRGELAGAARLEKAQAQFRAGEFAKAAETARPLLDSVAQRQDVCWLLAEAYAADGRSDDAIQYYRLLIDEFPDSNVAGDATYRLAYHLEQRGDAVEAARVYENLAARFPDNRLVAQALFSAAFAFAAAGQEAEAVRNWAALIARHGQSPLAEEALYRKGLAEIRLERRDEALKTLRELITRYPETSFRADAHYWQAILLRDAKQPADAERELRLALDAVPRPELARECDLQLAILLHLKGAYDEAAQRLAALLDGPVRARFSPSLLEWLAEYEIQHKRFDHAVAAADALTELGKDDVARQSAWALRGRALLAQNRTDDAVAAYEQALALPVQTPYAAEAALRLGESALGKRQFDRARERFERAAVLAGDEAQLGVRARAYLGLGRVARDRGDADAAARYFLSIGLLYDDLALVPEALYEAVVALRLAGREDDAKKTEAELRQRYPDSEWIRRLPPGG